MQNYWDNEEFNDYALWYALRCKPNFEFIVDSQLQQKNIESYFPIMRIRPVNPRSKTQKPFFPGYLFVKGSLTYLYKQKLGLTRGVVGLVSFDGLPAPISEGVIEVVRKQVRQEEDKLDCDPASFRRGEKVWIDDPALQGIQARFEQCVNGEDRVIVLLNLLGRTVRLQTEARKLKRRAY